MTDMVSHPPYYQGRGEKQIECIEALEACSTPEEFRGFLKLTVLKYLWRCNDKDNLEQDLAKANWYLNRLLEFIRKPGTLEIENTSDTR